MISQPQASTNTKRGKTGFMSVGWRRGSHGKRGWISSGRLGNQPPDFRQQFRRAEGFPKEPGRARGVGPLPGDKMRAPRDHGDGNLSPGFGLLKMRQSGQA